MGWFEYEKATIKEQTVKNLILNINGNLGYTVMANAFDDRPIDIVYANNVRKDQILKLIIETKVLIPACSIMMDIDYCQWSGLLGDMTATFAEWLRWHLGGEVSEKIILFEVFENLLMNQLLVIKEIGKDNKKLLHIFIVCWINYIYPLYFL